jgi:uncharacterized protein
MRGLAVLAGALMLLTFGALPGHAEKRVALVIGNGDYQHADKLANPVADARGMRDALGRLGFDIVYGENLAKQQLEYTIGRFASAAQDSDVALVFFAGHGATFGDVPYVVPVDAQFTSLAEVPYQLVQVETLIGELRRAKGLRIAILDACRDNAAERELKRKAVRGGEVTRGLARVRNAEGLILAYATQYLSTADDGNARGNSPFTTALLHHIATPGLDVRDLFYNVGREVVDATQGRQRPETSISFYERYALVPAAVAPAPAPPPQARPTTDPCAEARDHWRSAELIASVAAFEDHLTRFPDCAFAALARARIEELKKKTANLAPPPEARPSAPPAAEPMAASEAAQAWASIKDTTSIPTLEAFINRFGDSFYADLARARLAELKKVAAVGPVVRAPPERDVTECDRLAGDPYDDLPPGVAAVEKTEISATLAVPACRAALAQRPDDLRVAYQLGRALRASNEENDKAEGLRLIRRAAEADHVAAAYTLGDLYELGEGVPQDYTQARQWYEKAAAAGHALAMYDLGSLYELGSGVRTSATQARQWCQKGTAALEKAAAAGNINAMALLASEYTDLGHTCSATDYARGRQWYEKAAAAGHGSAMYNLGQLYEEGTGVRKNFAQARQWYEKAAAAGHVDAMVNLADFYEKGTGGPKDYAVARQWYEKAAAAGDAGAMNNLGVLYDNGQGVPQDYAQARQWYEKAAAAGDANAMYNLGAVYENGDGVLRDYTLARQWYEKAAAAGDEDVEKKAKKALRQIRGKK